MKECLRVVINGDKLSIISFISNYDFYHNDFDMF